MTFSRADADIHVPNGGDPEAALERVTQLCVAAHQDDIEIMAHAGICDCLDRPGQAFGGVVVTNGAGSPRSGAYAHLDDAAMQQVRREEQRRAADLGRYAIQIQLAHPSADVKTPGHAGLSGDLAAIFAGCSADTVFLHNPADKHDTHVALLVRCIEALRALPEAQRPRRVLGCEVWRDLDWLPDEEKIALDSGRHPELAAKLLAVFDSQIAGGKRYDLAVLGRRRAHATFHTSHRVDQLDGIAWAIDLRALISDPELDIAEYTAAVVDRFRNDVTGRIRKFL